MVTRPIWPYVGVVAEGEPLSIGPIENIWAHKWEPVEGLQVTVVHPQYPDQSYDTQALQVMVDGRRVTFASVELSNMVYGFFAPDPAGTDRG